MLQITLKQKKIKLYLSFLFVMTTFLSATMGGKVHKELNVFPLVKTETPFDEHRFSDWMTHYEFRKFYRRKINDKFLPLRIEGRLTTEDKNQYAEYRGIFVKKEGLEMFYFACWGYKKSDHEKFMKRYFKKGYSLMSLQTFMHRDGELRYQQIWGIKQ